MHGIYRVYLLSRVPSGHFAVGIDDDKIMRNELIVIMLRFLRRTLFCKWHACAS